MYGLGGYGTSSYGSLPVTSGGPITITGANCSQSNTSTSAAITQEHLLTGYSCSQVNSSSSGAISQEYVLLGANCSQQNVSSSGAITQEQTLIGVNCSQANTCSSGTIFIPAIPSAIQEVAQIVVLKAKVDSITYSISSDIIRLQPVIDSISADPVTRVMLNPINSNLYFKS